ncbi:DUF262 domain-containing protein [Streptomonospora sp. PA3]|uniref:GmrSD restriction endonuclease domain-containing protein n=1 Tax=Streptomonospora sp. PA3 TaxID=2607326 RepID=UPI0012DE58A2|nr:DUF262 domain-containing protein [Streptomonospora sp. PA3]MUL40948.1 DUF262 domain-containing protein [Streptomonospora sp. PA3]
MPVKKTANSVEGLAKQISRGEIKLPEIQRAYVWKPPQVARLVESLYRGYPTGSLLFWETDEAPATRDAATSDVAEPAVRPLYLLDGQQRLTSLHRVLSGHPEAQIVFNVETQAFQNQSAATRQDARWVRVYDIVHPDTDLFDVRSALLQAGIPVESKDIGTRLNQLAAVVKHDFHMEVLSGFSYEEVTQIFTRVNSGGRNLKTVDLAQSTLSARWPGILRRMETEQEFWTARSYKHIDVTFLTRALTGAVLGRGLSSGAHARLVSSSDAELDRGWTTVQRGLRRLVPLLQENLGITHSSLLPSMVTLIPLVVLLGEYPRDKQMDKGTANGILYWFLAATVRARYSGSTDTVLGRDIPAVREPAPVRALLENLGIGSARMQITAQTLAGKNRNSPFFLLSFLVCRRAGATDWWSSVVISAAGEHDQRLECHHIHPQATLTVPSGRYAKNEINDLANLAFISGHANSRIARRSPADYFPELDPGDLRAHCVPIQENLRRAESYREFLAARRQLLAARMNDLLEEFRPEWLDDIAAEPDATSGTALEFAVYDSDWDRGRITVRAHYDGHAWTGDIGLPELEEALDAVSSGLDADLEVCGETFSLSSDGDVVEVPIGPFLVTGKPETWQEILIREKEEARPLSQFQKADSEPWRAPRVSFPVAAVD